MAKIVKEKLVKSLRINLLRRKEAAKLNKENNNNEIEKIKSKEGLEDNKEANNKIISN